MARDSSRADGISSWCKACKAAARRGEPAPPRGLVLVMPLPAPRPDTPEPDDTPPEPAAAGHYAKQAAAFIAALDPPAGPADGLLCTSLRGLADIADGARYSLDPGRTLNTTTATMIRVMRELNATRAAKASSGSPQATPVRGKLDSFREAL